MTFPSFQLCSTGSMMVASANWQKDVINDLVVEKKTLLNDMKLLKKELAMMKEEISKL